MDYDNNNEQDVSKLIEIINHHKTEISDELENEFGDFINFEQNDSNDIFFEDSDSDTEDFDETSNSQQEHQSSCGLTEDEADLINSCADPDLQQVLSLNRLKNFKLIKLLAYIDKLLGECDRTIDRVENNCNSEIKLIAPIKTPCWKLGAPYFKCADYYCSPLNEDVKRKRNNKELLLCDFLYKSKAWTKLDCENLLNSVLLNYHINKEIDLKRQLSFLKHRITNDDDDDDRKNLHDLEVELKKLRKADTNHTPPLNSDDYIDWDKVADSFFQDRRNGAECRALWHIYLHPGINKRPWTRQENNNLVKLVKEYNYQNWEIISLKLESNRSPFIVALHYYRDLHDRYIHTKFTRFEDQLLLELLDLYRMGNFIPWRKISEYFPNRSRHQLYHHYQYYLAKDNIKKGKFSVAEDILLLILVDRFGTDFRKCSEYIQNRSQVQLKSRYRQNLQNYKRKGTFTNHDDLEILKHVQHYGEGSWGLLGEKLNRTRGTLRQRYNTIKQYLKTNSIASIDEIPKRKHPTYIKRQQNYEFVRYVADKFKDFEIIPTLGIIEKFLKNPDNDDEHVVDNDDDGDYSINRRILNSVRSNKGNFRRSVDTMLIDFFSNSCKIKQQKSVKNFDQISNDVNQILTILNVNLDIPTDLHDDPRLDSIDKIILSRLTITNNRDNDQLIPPTLNSLIGLRSMLIKHKYLEKNETEDNRILWEIERDVLNYNLDQQNRINDDRQLFSERFNKLFTWSSILSLQPPPNATSTIDCESDDLEPVAKRRKMEIVRTYSRRSEPKPSTSQCDL